MAKKTRQSGSANIPLGSWGNNTQSIVYIPAHEIAGGGTADKPGLICLESVDSAATLDGVYLWGRSTGVLAYSTTYPTNELTDGTTLGASTGASLALDNLASVQINATLAVDNANTYDIGDDPDSIRTLYWTTSLKKIGTAYDVTLAATEPAAASYTYTFPDAAANADVMLNTGGANALTFTNGTANVTLGAAGSLDIGAAGTLDIGTGAVAFNGTATFDLADTKTVDIDEHVAIAGGAFTTSAACTIDQDLQVSASVTFADVTVTSHIALGDDDQIRLGALGATDAYIQWDATNDDLLFYDSNQASSITLSQLVAGTPLNPIVTGDLTISDGQFDWTNATAGDINTWTFANTDNNIFNIVADSLNDGYAIDINADAINDGTFIHLDTDETNGAFKFLDCHDGGGSTFSIALHGATVIGGSASGTAALTATVGDLKLTNGVIDADLAISTGVGHNFATACDATADTSFITITNSAAALAYPLLTIDGNMSGAVDAVDITYIGAGAQAVHIDVEAATGDGMKIEHSVASSTGQALVIDMSSWIGTAGQGIIDISSDSGAVAEAGHAIYIDLGGTTADAAAISGKGLYIKDAGGTQAGSYLVHLESTNNDAIHIAKGETVIDVDCHVTGGTNAGSTGVDLQFYGDTANRSMKWDSANDQFQFLDGTTTFKFESASTALHIDGSAANDILAIGSNSDTDVEFHGTTGGMDLQWDASANQLNLLGNAELNLDGPIVMSGVQAITDATDTDIVHPTTTIDTTGGAQTSALIDGQEGQIKYMLMVADNGDWVETPANFKDGTTITFNDVGDDAFLIFLGSNWNFVAGSATVA